MIKKICKAKHCNQYCDYMVGYCDEHLYLKELLEKKRKNNKQFSNDNNLYNCTRWRKIRAEYLLNDPLCVDCLKQGRYTPANEVHHKIPHKGNLELFWDSGNYEGLCKSCHSRHTSKSDGGFNNPIKR